MSNANDILRVFFPDRSLTMHASVHWPCSRLRARRFTCRTSSLEPMLPSSRVPPSAAVPADAC